ncbi:MAG: PDZ domain-containing protein [bacterium]
MLKKIGTHRNSKLYAGALIMLGIITMTFNHVGAFEKKQKGWLGVSVQEMTPSMKDEYKIGNRSGLLITDVLHNSPADDAGLWEEDVIVEFDGKQVEKSKEFARMVRNMAPETEVKLKVVRDGEEKEIAVTIGKRKISRRRSPIRWNEHRMVIIAGRPRLGVRVEELNKDLAPYFNVKEHSGVLIWEVFEDSPAEDAGLKAGDIITKLDDEPILDPGDLVNSLEDYEEGDIVTVEYVRKGKTKTVEVELEEYEFPDIRIGRPGRGRIRIQGFDLDRLRMPEIYLPKLKWEGHAI